MIGRALALCAALTGPADAACRQALALGLDISGSVDAAEYRLQLDGLADALIRPAVQSALFATPGVFVALSVYEWADPGQVQVIQPWVDLIDPGVVTDVANDLRTAPRPDFGLSTGLGAALQAGGALLAQRPDCTDHTLDISGDGPSNTGPRPRSIRREPGLAQVTVNALIVAQASALQSLQAYFMAEVIHGPGAFVETATGFEDYADAMERKLIRELRVIMLGKVTPPDTRQ